MLPKIRESVGMESDEEDIFEYLHLCAFDHVDLDGSHYYMVVVCDNLIEWQQVEGFVLYLRVRNLPIDVPYEVIRSIRVTTGRAFLVAMDEDESGSGEEEEVVGQVEE